MRSHTALLFYVALQGPPQPWHSMEVCHLKSIDSKLAFHIPIARFTFVNEACNYQTIPDNPVAQC